MESEIRHQPVAAQVAGCTDIDHPEMIGERHSSCSTGFHRFVQGQFQFIFIKQSLP